MQPHPPKDDQDGTVTFRALKVVSYGGPIAVAMSSMGVLTLTLAYHANLEEHLQGSVLTAGATMIVLGFVEWALARRFHRHENREAADRLSLVTTLQAQHKEQLQLLIDNNQAILQRAMLQIESVGAEYDHINSMLKELVKDGEARSASIDLINEKVRKLSEEVTALLAWRERLSSRLPR